MKIGDRIHGFEVKRIIPLNNLYLKYIELEHIKTGARHVHLESEDKENCFMVAFKTIPEDSTGVAHILEHTVLAGSEKYPIRDPFFSMIKRSMNTFMNAFTSADWTAYPYCSQNEKDYYNLMSVYMDAAFKPKISELSFMQEGHRLDFEDEKLVYKGVVYNEMKGSMSAPDRILGEAIEEELYSTTTYSENAGGDPKEIVKLTHNDLKKFHTRFYHPSNAYFYTYGNLSIEKTLEFIDKEYLSKYEKIDPKTEVEHENRWDKERENTYFYPASSDDDKYQACLSWLSIPCTDSFEVLVLEILDEVLLGSPASPLKRTLIDSGLGTDLSDYTGLNTEYVDTFFSCGLKGVKKEDVDKIKPLILESLEKIAKSGIDKEIVESAIQNLEFERKEITHNPYRYGLGLSLYFLSPWIHGGDPVDFLDIDQIIDKLKDKLSKSGYLEGKIKEYFLDNNHRALIKLAPDKEMFIKEEERVIKELDEKLKELSDQDKENIQKTAQELLKLQEKEEDLSCLPRLSINNLSDTIVKTDYKALNQDSTLLHYNENTRGFDYLSIFIDIDNISKKNLKYLSIFSNLFSKIGTDDKNFIELSKDVDKYTGEVRLSVHSATDLESQENKKYLLLKTKCLRRHRKKMLEIVKEIFTKINFNNKKVLKTFLDEYKSEIETSIIHAGHEYAVKLAAKNISTSQYLNELWFGVTKYRLLKEILDNNKIDELSNALEVIKEEFLCKDNVKTAWISDDADVEVLDSFVNDINNISKPCSSNNEVIELEDKNTREGWSIPSDVSFVACSFEVPKISEEDSAILLVASKILGRDFLHREIREKGGAYGGMCKYDYNEGVFSFVSYRDPHIKRTLEVYNQAFEFIQSGNFSDQDVEEAVIGACSDLDRPNSPSEKARIAFIRHNIHLSDEMRESFKKRLLKVSKKDILNVAEKYFQKKWQDCGVAVISSREKLEEANLELNNKLEMKNI